MAMRRRFQKRRSFPRRRGLRKPAEHGTGRWERGELGSDQTLVVSDDFTNFTLVTSLGQISGHTFDAGDTQGVRNAVFFENAIRRLEVGGLVFDAGVRVPARDSNIIEDSGAYCIAGMCLVYDRLATDGVPLSLSPSWGRANVPMVTPSGLDTNDADTDFPTRILWRKSTIVDWTCSAQTSIVNRFERPTYPHTWSVNLRTRLQLPDDYGLFLHQWFRLPSARTFPIDFAPEIDFWLIGSIFYRFKL